ncbi:ABC transporter permease [Limnochorda pilosa]|uniref:ABC-2 type transporter transmembrane domain-containing protein n=1 Tax=Limnochorda pilosa TaxID=1555112 RepID=A0A0K2SG01_LIMPI|nr:ABC transporter permease [Limnochorda pilosa]BAS26020.1 hypothetical protein LIP_0163 [Limnochorda pilosa]
MKPWQVIARREFRQLAGGRTFIIITVVGALIIGGLAFAPALLEFFSTRETQPERVLVAAPQALFQELERSARNLQGARPVRLEWLGPSLDEAGRAAADERLRSDEAGGWLEIAPQPGPEPLRVRFTQIGAASRLFATVQQMVTPLVTAARAGRLGVDPQRLADLQRPVQVEGRVLDVGGRDPLQTALAQGLSYVLLFGLYMAIILYGSSISTGVIQEKGSRVVELLAGATSPTQILVGKVLGIGGAGLLQFVVWMLVGLLFSLPQAASGLAARLGFGAVEVSVRAIPVSTLLYFTLFFLVGYTLYALLYAAFASTVSRMEEANQALMIPVFLVIIGFFVAITAWGAPESRVAVVGSLIPFFTPMALFTRIVLTPVPVWEILTGLGLTLATILLVLAFAARAYRRNILRYRRVTLKELFTGRGGERPA